MRVLLIEDDRMMARSIEMMLNASGFIVDKTDAGEDGIDLSGVYDYDLILLDLSLPDMSGLDVLRTLRRGRNETPIMILSGTAQIDSKVKALSLGADDYMTKPFHKDELVARLRAVIRRSKGHAQSLITVGDMVIDLDAKVVHVNDQRIHLTGREYQTLELMALRKGKAITKDIFLSSLYGGMDEPGAKIVDVFICKLRKKLAPVTDGRHVIETVWGGGYVLREAGAIPESTAA
ncbi:MAG: DNA-binding response regulator [Phenylobacterium sp. RIFCSPHIGHO2_01_FULL_69_31]|uniref:response regulator transcription factor n=1 Tax=Phenylobacterium sp. RIFCSPHIGHO2_01_FULL_69_31 TaxID=1801944 RepID=UPI0008AE7B41|nr:response regulator transcription factor [Phenylobacterium sp. RIFCSPHIGHO2_01_FULL_69_31]OHB30758.1 MAG: DNA-binding response regulator [Phenylobacterium sp. RIFCSPHIGHO2_01_FULL_69_31]